MSRSLALWGSVTGSGPRSAVPMVPVARVVPDSQQTTSESPARSKDLNVKCTRLSYNIAEDLPVTIWCPNAQDCAFQPCISAAGLISTGMTYAARVADDNKGILLTFTKGGVSDTVLVETNTPTPYAIKQQMLKTGWFIGTLWRETVGSNYQAQFATDGIYFGQMFWDGKIDADSIGWQSGRPPSNFLPYVLDFNMEFTVDPNTFFIVLMSATGAVDGDKNVITHTLRIQKFNSDTMLIGPVIQNMDFTI